jgi:ABC-type multidrug transport system fused ATPase/permease subunit
MVDQTIYQSELWYSGEKKLFRDFCTYWRKVLFWPVFNITANVALVGLIVYMVSQFKSSGSGAVFQMILAIFVVLLSMVFFIAVIFGVATGVSWTFTKLSESETIFHKIHDTFKNKYCSLVEVEKVEGEVDGQSSDW